MRAKLLLVLRRPTTKTATGGYSGAHTVVGRVWGKVRELRDEERFLAGGNQSVSTHRIIVRRNSRIRIEDRIRYADRDFEVVSIRDLDASGREFEVDCKLARSLVETFE